MSGKGKPDPSLLDAHLQHRAIVTEVIQPGQRGRVAYQGTTWVAFCRYQVVLPVNTPVRVVEQYSATTLIIEPVPLVNTPSLLPDNIA
ncbi:MAG: protease [Leptolyngbya sp. DLM2.Bin27]|nr:MAG: protease [Leptolyngbya sp. DLM2.Bin27]